jgi:hypothetical protein
VKEILYRRKGITNLGRYSTGLWSLDNEALLCPYVFASSCALGWRIFESKGGLQLKDSEALSKRYGFLPTGLAVETSTGDIAGWKSAAELLIFARDRDLAQRAANLVFAALVTYEGQLFALEGLAALPDDESERKKLAFNEDHRESCAQHGVIPAALLAARLSKRRRAQHAAMRFLISKRICSVHNMDTHPRYGRWFGVENDPLNHVLFAQAIVTAYAALEDLELEIRASRDKPSKLPNGEWNPAVKEDWETRARAEGIEKGRKQVWLARGQKSRVERARPYPSGETLCWTGGQNRDRKIDLFEAIAHADWLRDKAAAHALSKISSGIKMLDVDNIQGLVRRLILETTGLLPSELRRAPIEPSSEIDRIIV